MDKVTVSADALRQVLEALNGPGHHIRELQATRNLPGTTNPINTLTEEYNSAVDEHNAVNNMKECDHKRTTTHWDYVQCNECGWVIPSGPVRGPNKRGFFPSLTAVKMYDICGTYLGMGEVHPMAPNKNTTDEAGCGE